MSGIKLSKLKEAPATLLRFWTDGKFFLASEQSVLKGILRYTPEPAYKLSFYESGKISHSF